jgi:hypothetical protein
VNQTVRKFRSCAEAEKADREFYKKLSGNERLQILVELLNHAPEQQRRASLVIRETLSSRSISGVSSEEAFGARISGELDEIPVFIIGKDALIRNKRAVHRRQDLADPRH